jgi:hypothetical protein
MGNTGTSSGAHLDLKMYKDLADYNNKKAMDPLQFLTDYSLKKSGQISRTGSGSIEVSDIAGGGSREDVLRNLTSSSIIHMLSNFGIDQNAMAKLTGIAVGGLGKEFARNQGMGAVEDLRRAGQTSQLGYFQSPEQYLQARSQMTGVGGGYENLEEIMKNAVANGMDSSKNIMEMVNATSSLASKSAQSGVNSFSGASQLLGRGIDELRRIGVSENMAVSAAANAAQVTENYSTSTGATIANVIEQSRINQMFPNAKAWERAAMGRASLQQLETLRGLYKKGDTAGAQELATQMGFSSINSLESAEKLLNISRKQVTSEITGFGLDTGLEKSIQAKRNAGSTNFTREERAFMRAINPEVATEASMGMLVDRQMKQGQLQNAPGGLAGGGEKSLASSAIADAKLFEQGAKQISEAMGSLSSIGTIMKDVADKLNPEKYAASFKEAAKPIEDAGKSFSSSASIFEKGVKMFTDKFSIKSFFGFDQSNDKQAKGND